MNITLETAEAIADAAKARVYEGYSGRGMYGDKCLGFVVSHHRGEAMLDVAIMRVLQDDAVQFILRGTTDSLGLNTIVYYPGITIAEDM